ncbi:MAG: hypothetical protein PVH88_18075 [Ignavibacteria bacterium]|jgi:hypothetical protein
MYNTEKEILTATQADCSSVVFIASNPSLAIIVNIIGIIIVSLLGILILVG